MSCACTQDWDSYTAPPATWQPTGDPPTTAAPVIATPALPSMPMPVQDNLVCELSIVLVEVYAHMCDSVPRWWVSLNLSLVFDRVYNFTPCYVAA